MGTETEISLMLFGKFIRKLWEISGDLTIAITGDEGSGKSTLAYWIYYHIMKSEDFVKNIAYFADEAIMLMLFSPEKTVNWMDENPFYKRDTQLKENKAAVKVMKRNRFKKRCYLLLGLKISDFDLDLRDQRIKLWIKVEERGYAIILEPLQGEVEDRWMLKASGTTKRDIEQQEKKRKKSLGIGHIKFPDMPNDIKKVYDGEKAKAWEKLKEDYLEKMRDGKGANGKILLNQTQLVNCYNYFKEIKPDLKQTEFANALGIKYHTLTNALKASN